MRIINLKCSNDDSFKYSILQRCISYYLDKNNCNEAYIINDLIIR